MANDVAVATAVGTLTASGVFTDTQTVVIGGKTYTTQTALVNADGNVLIGADAATTLQNLFNAINLGPGAGTAYAAAMTRNDRAVARSVTATTLVVAAKVPGTLGNLVTTTETQTNAAWGAGTLASGTGDIGERIKSILRNTQCSAEVQTELLALTGELD